MLNIYYITIISQNNNITESWHCNDTFTSREGNVSMYIYIQASSVSSRCFIGSLIGLWQLDVAQLAQTQGCMCIVPLFDQRARVLLICVSMIPDCCNESWKVIWLTMVSSMKQWNDQLFKFNSYSSTRVFRIAKVNWYSMLNVQNHAFNW